MSRIKPNVFALWLSTEKQTVFILLFDTWFTCQALAHSGVVCNFYMWDMDLGDRFYARICLIKQEKWQGQFQFDRIASNRKYSILIETNNLIQLALYLGNWTWCKKKNHTLWEVFCLTFITTLAVFKNSCLTDYLFCVGLGKVKPSFTDQKSSNLTRFRWQEQIVSKFSGSGHIMEVYGKTVIFGCMRVSEEMLNDNTIQSWWICLENETASRAQSVKQGLI